MSTIFTEIFGENNIFDNILDSNLSNEDCKNSIGCCDCKECDSCYYCYDCKYCYNSYKLYHHKNGFLLKLCFVLLNYSTFS